MFEKKRILFPVITSALLVACGSGSDTSTTASGAGTSPANSSNPPAAPVVPPDQLLKGKLDVTNNQVLYIRTNRVIYLPVPMTEFESDTGIVDVAPGSPVAPIDGLEAVAAAAGCNHTNDGTCGVQPPAAAPDAPIAAFGIRIGTSVVPTATEQAVGNQTVVGRIAVDLTERTDSPGIGTNEVAESMKFIIDKVEIKTGPNGELESMQLQDGAQIHVDGRTAANVEVKADFPAPPETVRLLPLSEVPDNHGDTTSEILLLDFENGFSKAGQTLPGMEKLSGHFSAHITFGSIQGFVGMPGDASDVGEKITVNKEPPVSGAGINGNAWIRSFP